MNNEIIFSGNQERKQRAQEFITAIRHNIFSAVYQLKRLNDEQLYIDLGYQSFTECCQAELNLKRSSIFKYLKIADKFLPQSTDNSEIVQHGVLSEVQHAGLKDIAIEKLALLSKLPKKQTLRLLTEGKITIRGKVYTTDKLASMNRDYLAAVMKGEKRAPQPLKQDPNILPFDTVYKSAEKSFTKLLTELYKLDEADISTHDKQAIDIYLRKAISIYDKNYDIHKKLLQS